MRSRISWTLMTFALAVGFSPGAAPAQDSAQPAELGLALFPFEPAPSQRRSIVFPLEDVLRSGLASAIDRPVSLGPDLVPALPQGVDACSNDPFCLQLIGNQFSASLIVRTQVDKADSQFVISTEWFTAGNGLRVGREEATLPEGDEASLVTIFADWFTLYFETSLRVSPENRAGEGGVLGGGGSGDADAQRVEAYKQARTKKVSSRRQDFGSDRADNLFDPTDPTASLRALAEGEPEPERQRDRSRDKRRAQEELPPLQEEDYSLQADPEPSPSSSRESVDRADRAPTRDRKKTQPRQSEADPYASRDSREQPTQRPAGRIELSSKSRTPSSNAPMADLSPREERRFERSGLSFSDYQQRRWNHKGRVQLRAGGFYGAGWTTRRYATTVFVAAGGVKHEEYSWESLGASAVNPGGTLGVSYSPIGLVSVEFDFAVMYAKQDLRREYAGDEIGTNIPQHPFSRDSANVVLDLRGRVNFLPNKRIKPNGGLGLTAMVISGYTIDPETPLNYASRPPTAVIGLSPVLGVSLAINPFVSIYIDLQPTIYLSEGAANYESHQVLTEREEPGLSQEELQPRLSSTPLLFRGGVGTLISF